MPPMATRGSPLGASRERRIPNALYADGVVAGDFRCRPEDRTDRDVRHAAAEAQRRPVPACASTAPRSHRRPPRSARHSAPDRPARRARRPHRSGTRRPPGRSRSRRRLRHVPGERYSDERSRSSALGMSLALICSKVAPPSRKALARASGFQPACAAAPVSTIAISGDSLGIWDSGFGIRIPNPESRITPPRPGGRPGWDARADVP